MRAIFTCNFRGSFGKGLLTVYQCNSPTGPVKSFVVVGSTWMHVEGEGLDCCRVISWRDSASVLSSSVACRSWRGLRRCARRSTVECHCPRVARMTRLVNSQRQCRCKIIYLLTLGHCLQYFDTVGWAAGRACGCKKLSGEVLAWFSVWSKVQTCIWPSWCHCHSLSLASVKSRLVLPSGTGSCG